MNQGRGVSLALNSATEHFNFIYSGEYDYADSYKRGNDGPIVRATLFESNTHNLTLATHTDGGGVYALNLGYQKIPRQGFVNQRMDMTDNEGLLGSLSYNRDFSWGNLDGRLYYHQTHHKMDMLPLPERGGKMLMLADGKDLGYRVRAQIPLFERNTLRIGNEYHQFRLQDWYPGVASSWGQTQDFLSIKDGKRDRLGTFAEWQIDWNPALSTLVGVRNDIVWMDTGNVQSYWGNIQTSWAPAEEADAVAFNAISHARSDFNFDVTALSRYKPNEWSTYEIGLAQKTRSPNLYERYAWKTANSMINIVGDHNGWRGDPDLKPEVAYTASIVADWHSPLHTNRYLRIAPYFTAVKDFIDGKIEIDWRPYQEPTVGLRYTNVSRAELYGVDMDAVYDINTTWIMCGSLGYTYGSNRDNGEPLYNIMPLHGNVAIEPTFGALKGAIEMEWVARKDRISPTHLELPTDEYTLLNLRASYNKKSFRIDAGIENMLDKLYDLPLGGVNDIESSKTYYKDGFRNFAVPGKGRSLYIGVSVEF